MNRTPPAMRSRPLALVRRPGPHLAEGLVTHIERTPIDPDLAATQWDEYVAALRRNGWGIAEVIPADECPDAVFVEDALVLFDDLAVVTRPGAVNRRLETAGAEAAAEDLGLTVERITAPGTLDGGDVLKVEDAATKTAYVGLGGRTNREGIDQLAELITDRGYTVVPVPTQKVLHLKSAVTALPDGTIIGFDPIVDDPNMFARYLSVPEESGAHVVHLGEDRLLMATGCPQTAALLESRGYSITLVNISEFERLEGCVTCLSVRVR